MTNGCYAIKTEIRDSTAEVFTFAAQKTMYGGKQISTGDTIFIFASENEGGYGLIARGAVTSAEAVPLKRGVARHIARLRLDRAFPGCVGWSKTYETTI